VPVTMAPGLKSWEARLCSNNSAKLSVMFMFTHGRNASIGNRPPKVEGCTNTRYKNTAAPGEALHAGGKATRWPPLTVERLLKTKYLSRNYAGFFQ
ncbi:MAG: hypothetical protein PVJ17_14300, partial [Lysobacterales bacterium]